MPSTLQCDVAIAGGGLAGSLIALALHRERPSLDIRLIDSHDRFGGNHLWSFFRTDIDAAHRWLVAPLIGHGWRGHSVAFPEYRRQLATSYYSIESSRLDQLVRARLPAAALMTGRAVLAASARSITFADGSRLEARGVIDCRGPGDLGELELGWQKFLGREIELSEPHALADPIVMDASVAQDDGYRFVYTLPFAATRIFIEDTYYSDTRRVDTRLLGSRIDAYARERGWQADRVVREEVGALPIAIGGDFEAYWRSGGKRIAKAGMRAGLFHPMTGYSLPDAVRLAVAIATATDLSGEALHDLTHGFARKLWRERRFYRMLAAMLFRAAEPDARYRVLERFYRLDAGLIDRFYSGQTTLADKARILTGKPPVPIGRAIAAIRSMGA